MICSANLQHWMHSAVLYPSLVMCALSTVSHEETAFSQQSQFASTNQRDCCISRSVVVVVVVWSANQAGGNAFRTRFAFSAPLLAHSRSPHMWMWNWFFHSCQLQLHCNYIVLVARVLSNCICRQYSEQATSKMQLVHRMHFRCNSACSALSALPANASNALSRDAIVRWMCAWARLRMHWLAFGIHFQS